MYNNTLGREIEVYSWFITLFGCYHLSPSQPVDSGLLQNGNGVSTWGIPLLVWEQGLGRKVCSIVQQQFVLHYIDWETLSLSESRCAQHVYGVKIFNYFLSSICKVSKTVEFYSCILAMQEFFHELQNICIFQINCCTSYVLWIFPVKITHLNQLFLKYIYFIINLFCPLQPCINRRVS